jgi:type IV secretion system protein VirD4
MAGLLRRLLRRPPQAAPADLASAILSLHPDPLAAVQTAAAFHGYGLYAGAAADRLVTAKPEQALLVLGPPRSKKTSAVVAPTVLAAPAAVVSTSTKPDVLALTARARARLGTLWVFDPSRTTPVPPGARELRWSPVVASRTWDGALAQARAMVAAADPGKGVTDATHWTERAGALLAPMLYAAALGGLGMRDVLRWVLDHGGGTAADLLDKQRETKPDRPLSAEEEELGRSVDQERARLAQLTLLGIAKTERREQSSIFSALAGVLEAYRSEAALWATDRPNFDPGRFVAARDTVYIVGPADLQALVAPVIVGLLDDVRRATYARFHTETAAGRRPWPVVFALDEVANIAPLPNLPAMISEGGGQGAPVLACLQDLSQARVRWGQAADGFLSLFGAKLILPGIGDSRTLEAVSTICGEWDRPIESLSSSQPPPPPGKWIAPAPTVSRTVTTHRERVLSPSAVARGEPGKGLLLGDGGWQVVELTPVWSHAPWTTVLEAAAHAGGLGPHTPPTGENAASPHATPNPG